MSTLQVAEISVILVEFGDMRVRQKQRHYMSTVTLVSWVITDVQRPFLASAAVSGHRLSTLY